MGDSRKMKQPSDAVREAADFNVKLAQAIKILGRVKGEDIEIATAPKEEVFREEKTVLYHYTPTAKRRIEVPVLIVYGLIGRYTMADLQEDRSLIRNMLAQGVDLYVVDWGHATRADRWSTLDDYVDGYLADCIDWICEHHGVPAVNLLGICEGGVFTLCYAALHARKVKNLALTITPVDFHGDKVENKLGHGFINIWTRSLAPEDIDSMIEVCGNLPGEFMSAVFSMMTPLKSMTKYNLDLLDLAGDDKKILNFLRMEKWLADRPHHPGEAAKQWLKDLYQQNKLIRNEFEIAGTRVDLGKVRMPVLNIYAKDDHIIPPACSRVLGTVIGSKDYTELALPGGHVGLFVSGKSQGIVGSGIVEWLANRP